MLGDSTAASFWRPPRRSMEKGRMKISSLVACLPRPTRIFSPTKSDGMSGKKVGRGPFEKYSFWALPVGSSADGTPEVCRAKMGMDRSEWPAQTILLSRMVKMGELNARGKTCTVGPLTSIMHEYELNGIVDACRSMRARSASSSSLVSAGGCAEAEDTTGTADGSVDCVVVVETDDDCESNEAMLMVSEAALPLAAVEEKWSSIKDIEDAAAACGVAGSDLAVGPGAIAFGVVAAWNSGVPGIDLETLGSKIFTDLTDSAIDLGESGPGDDDVGCSCSEDALGRALVLITASSS